MLHDLTFITDPGPLRDCGWQYSELPMGTGDDPEPYWTKLDTSAKRGYRTLSEATDSDRRELLGWFVEKLMEHPTGHVEFGTNLYGQVTVRVGITGSGFHPNPLHAANAALEAMKGSE